MWYSCAHFFNLFCKIYFRLRLSKCLKQWLKVKANLSSKNMKLHKGQNTHVLSLPLGMEGTGVRESKSAGQNNTMYHESCHYQNNNYCFAWRWKRNYICTHNLKNVTCKLLAFSCCKKLQVKMLSSLLSSNLNYSWLLIIMNDNHNCELFMNMKQDMKRDLWLVRYMPLGVERTDDNDDDLHRYL